MSDKILKNNGKARVLLESLGEKVPQTPTPTTPSESSGWQVPQTLTPTNQQASFYNPEKEIGKLHGYFIAVVVFVVITLLIEIYTMNLDRIKDKDLYLRYNDLYQKYSNQNFELNDRINEQKIEVNNLQNEIKMLRAKNPLLK